jgi:hypothetical protein
MGKEVKRKVKIFLGRGKCGDLLGKTRGNKF